MVVRATSLGVAFSIPSQIPTCQHNLLLFYLLLAGKYLSGIRIDC